MGVLGLGVGSLMRPQLSLLQRLKIWNFRRRLWNDLHVKDAIEFINDLDRTHWLHRRGDGMLVVFQWDTTVARTTNLDELSQWIAASRGNRFEIGNLLLILDSTTRGDTAILDSLNRLKVDVQFVRNHPSELKTPFQYWIRARTSESGET